MAGPASAISRTAWHGGDFARFRRGRAFLRRPLESLRQPDPPQRLGGAEARISAQADFRRACRRAGHVGARRRLRRGVDAHHAPRSAAIATCSTATRCGSPTARSPTRWWSTPRPTALPARAASRRSSSRRGFKGFQPAQKLDKLGMRGSDTSELVFTDCEVPEENVLGAVGNGVNVLMQRPRLRARGAGRRSARHHAGLPGRGDALCARPQAVRPADRALPADAGASSPTCM